MFSKVFTIAAIAAVAVSNVAAFPTMIARHHQLAARATTPNAGCPNITKEYTPSVGWPTADLEDYTCYHTRYLALSCVDKHGDKTFFNSCCTPLAKGQSISDRPAECNPFQVNAAADDNNDDDCNDDDQDPVTSSPAPAPTSPSDKKKPSHKPTSSTKSTTKPTSTKKHSSTSPAKATAASGGNFITGGIATFFEQGGFPGACGKTHKDSDFVVAVDVRRYGNPDARSKLCGQTVEITNLKNGKTIQALVADACPTCENGNCLDLSHGAFFGLGGTVDEGIFPIKYRYVDN